MNLLFLMTTVDFCVKVELYKTFKTCTKNKKQKISTASRPKQTVEKGSLFNL